jgi:hypothetical protein
MFILFGGHRPPYNFLGGTGVPPVQAQAEACGHISLRRRGRRRYSYLPRRDAWATGVGRRVRLTHHLCVSLKC